MFFDVDIIENNFDIDNNSTFYFERKWKVISWHASYNCTYKDKMMFSTTDERDLPFLNGQARVDL